MKRFSNVLLVVNTNQIGFSALKQAVSIAKKNGASLTVASVLEELPSNLRMSVLAVNAAEIRDIAKAEELDRLSEYLTVVEEQRVPLEKKVLIGRGFVEIIRQVLNGKHDLLIKDAEISDRLLDEFFGSTEMHLMRKCPCPVWVTWPGRKRYRRILACVDFDPGSSQNDALNRQIIEMASSLTVSESGELHVIHAIEPFGEKYLRIAYIANRGMNFDELIEAEKKTRKDWLEALLDEESKTIRVDHEEFPNSRLHLIEGRARDVVPEKARELNADLIVLGTLSRTGIPGYFIGNTSENILNQVRC